MLNTVVVFTHCVVIPPPTCPRRHQDRARRSRPSTRSVSALSRTILSPCRTHAARRQRRRRPSAAPARRRSQVAAACEVEAAKRRAAADTAGERRKRCKATSAASAQAGPAVVARIDKASEVNAAGGSASAVLAVQPALSLQVRQTTTDYRQTFMGGLAWCPLQPGRIGQDVHDGLHFSLCSGATVPVTCSRRDRCKSAKLQPITAKLLWEVWLGAPYKRGE